MQHAQAIALKMLPAEAPPLRQALARRAALGEDTPRALNLQDAQNAAMIRHLKGLTSSHGRRAPLHGSGIRASPPPGPPPHERAG